MKEDINFRLKYVISSGIRRCVLGENKKTKWVNYVDYTLDNLRLHLESLFTDGMRWETYGRAGWHIDHKIPIKYVLEDGSYYWNQEELSEPTSETFRKCWSLNNLQPKWAFDNISKSNRYADL